MRRQLLLATLAVTSLLVLAFAVPLAILVRDVAHDRALTAAERDLAALAPVLAATTTDRGVLEAAIAQTDAGQDDRMALWLPNGARLGDDRADDEADVALARDGRLAFSRDVDGEVRLYRPVVAGEEVAVIRVRVPDELLRSGVARSWAVLAVVAVALLAVAVAAIDRLARSVVRPATDLARSSRALAGGDSTARATVAGPPEIAEAASAFNALADRIDELRAAERERVADLSHRLRTPLTALRLEAEAAGQPGLVAQVDRLEAEISEQIRAARRPLREEVVARCDLTAVVEERAAFWGALADDGRRGWTVSIEPPGPHHVRLTDADAAAAVDVLLGNVFSHTPDGTPYALAVLADGERVRLIVDDGGPGIDRPEVARKRGQSEGRSTGLGLDIAESTARAGGGEMRIERSPLGGARVELDLPAAAADAARPR